MLYFRGCTARERINSISDSTEKLLKLAKIDFKTLDNEECCGSVLLRTGFEDEAKQQMKKNVANLKDEKIVVSCAGCYKTLKNDYNDLLGVELDIIHISQLLHDLIEDNRLGSNKLDFNSLNFNSLNPSSLNPSSLNSNGLNSNEPSSISASTSSKYEFVTYHDPCHLGRHMEEFDAPREVIKSFSNLREMENIRENSRCCGSGGGVKSAFPEIAKSIAIERGEEAENTGCNVLVTSCPFCKLNLDENSSLEVLDLSEFVLKRLVSENSNKNETEEDLDE